MKDVYSVMQPLATDTDPSALLVPVSKKSSSQRSGSGCCQCRVIDPSESSFLRAWGLLVAAVLILTAFLAPWETAFLEPRLDWIFCLDRVIDIVFVCDMALQLFISIPDPQRPSKMITTPHIIASNYLTGWFSVDCLSMLPVDLYILCFDGNDASPMRGLRNLKVVRLARLVRLLRLARLSLLMERWHTSFGFSYATLSLAKFFAMVALCCHWMACLWGGIAMRGEGSSWLQAVRIGKGGPEDVYDGPFQVYTVALYWAVITLTSVGYGDVTPQTMEEYWVATLCASLSACMWAYVIGAVCGIVATMDPHEVNFRRTMDDLNWLMLDHDVPQDARKKFRRYFHYTVDIARQRGEKNIIEHMSPKLQGEFAHFLHQDWLSKVWYLNSMPRRILVFLSRSLSLSAYIPDEDIFVERTLCIVRSGVASKAGKVLVGGDVWGEDFLLSNNALRNKDAVRSLSYLSVLSLHARDLFSIVSNFPEARRRLHWVCARLAMRRGVLQISRLVRKRRGSIDMNSMTDGERLEFFKDALRGGASEVPGDSSPCRDISAVSDASQAFPSALVNSSVSKSPSRHESSATLEEKVEEMNRRMAEMNLKLNALLNQSSAPATDNRMASFTRAFAGRYM
mmetsp:Transcript_114522/g.330846  ORF Transcript_114522/g.330846 Transcript_114522/m.330846 type:complete len:624 (+) Transcript_114522:85-1956(+)